MWELHYTDIQIERCRAIVDGQSAGHRSRPHFFAKILYRMFGITIQ